MRTQVIEVYKFAELSDEAKESAHENYIMSGDTFPWFNEWQDSLNAFCDIAPVEWLRFDVSAAHIDASFNLPDIAEMSGVRAWKWLLNNGWIDLAKRNSQGDCTLTGYCGDCPLFDPITTIADNPESCPELEQLFYECLQSWVYSCREDQEDSETMGYFEDAAEANQWEFFYDGSLA